VHQRGERLVEMLTGVGLLKFGTFRPLEAGAVRGGGPAGEGVTVFPGMAVLYMPSNALLAFLDYSLSRPPVMNITVGAIVAGLPPVERWGVLEDPDVQEALRLLPQAARNEDWRLLYVVYEIIEDDHAGQLSRVARQLGGTTVPERTRCDQEIRRFRDTANSRRALGSQARHGHDAPAPAKPMTFPEALSLVQGLLLAWVRALARLDRRRERGEVS
jgi:hypothetical protein